MEKLYDMRRIVMKKFIVSLFFGCLLFAISSCSKARTLDDIKADGKLIVSTNAEFPPFEYKDGDELTGFDIDLIKMYGEYIGVEVEINNVDFDGALLNVSSNKADLVIAAVTKNAEREKSLSFSNGYFLASQVVIVKKGSGINGNNIEEILQSLSDNNAVIAAQAGTVGEYYAKGDSDWGFEVIPNTTCQTYDNGAQAVLALNNGQVDAVIIDQLPAIALSESYADLEILGTTLTEEEYAIGVAKGNTSLVDSLNEFLVAIEENGQLETLLEKYFGE